MGLNMSREEMLAALRAERLGATQRLIAARAEARTLAEEIEGLEARLRDIDHAEGYLAG